MTITTVHVKEITMVAPDIICVRVRDQEVVNGPLIDHGSPDGAALGSVVTRTDPTDGVSKECLIVGRNADHYKFFDVMPTAFLDRAAANNPANYPTIGGRTVTTIYSETLPYDEAHTRVGGIGVNIATMEHRLFLQLSGNLPQGGPYTVSVAGNTFPSTQFTFNDKVTRAEFVRSTQLGHRLGEKFKWAYFSGWIPGYGTEGRIDVPGAHSLTTFDILDKAGGIIASGLPLTLSSTPTDVEVWGNNDYASSINSRTANSVTVGNPTTIGFATAHGLSNGQKVFCRGFSGLNIDNFVNNDRTMVAATVVNPTTITVPIDTTGQTWAQGAFQPGYDGMVYLGYSANSANTYVYKCDYSTVALVPGEYRIRIPGLGVGDSFRVDEDVHMQAITTYAKGYYNQASGYALNGWGGWTRPADYKDGVNGCQIFESLAPSTLSSETGWTAPVTLSAELTAASPWLTATRATGFGGSMRDAGDWDYHVIRHCPMAYVLGEFGFRSLPSSAKGLKFGFPNASSFIGSTYSDIDALDDSIHMALMQIETFRATQKGDGRVYSGLQFGTGPFYITGGGGSTVEPSFISTQQGVALAADPMSNMVYAGAAAKIAQIFSELGFTAHATAWTTSAVNAFAWANALWVDYAANGATGSAIQAYFNTTLGVQAKMGWDNATFATWVGHNFDRADQRYLAAVLLYGLTGNTTYSNIIVPAINSNLINDGNYDGAWVTMEIANCARLLADFPDPAINAGQLSSNIARISSMAMNFQGAFLHEGTGGQTYQGSNSPGIDAFVLRSMAFNKPTDQNTNYLKVLHAQMQAQHGANQLGLSMVTSGIGVRNAGNASLICDRQAMGIKGRDITGTAVYFVNGASGWNFVFNNWGGDTQGNFTAELYTGLYEAYAGSKKMLSPKSHTMIPKQQAYMDASMIIYNNEFVTQQTIAPSYVAARWQHALGGNTQTTPSIQRIRRSLVAAP